MAAGSRVTEVQGDLFQSSVDSSLAHCVSQDMHMGKGIAVAFKKMFGGVSELKAQGAQVGQMAVLQRDSRYIYYLVTKEKYSQKPSYISLRSSLEQVKQHCLNNKVQSLAMPRIGCGLDRLDWAQVKQIIEQVFSDTDINITVYSL